MTFDRRQSIIDRIQERTEAINTGFKIDGIDSPCFQWTGPTSGTGRGGGYGRMSLNGQTVAVHLVAYTHFFGFIPGTKQIDHLCSNRLCWRKEHLEMVTHQTNQKRRSERLSVPPFVRKFNASIQHLLQTHPCSLP